MINFWIKYLYFQFIDIYKLYQNNKYSRGMQNDSNIVRRIWDINHHSPSNNHLIFGRGTEYGHSFQVVRVVEVYLYDLNLKPPESVQQSSGLK